MRGVIVASFCIRRQEVKLLKKRNPLSKLILNLSSTFLEKAPAEREVGQWFDERLEKKNEKRYLGTLCAP